MVRIPKKFKIKGQLWRVEYKWNLNNREPGEPVTVSLDGLCDTKRRIIFIDKIILREEKWIVFLHEYIHAVLFESHISGLDGPAGDMLEEVICEGIATSFNDNFNMKWKRQRE